MPICPPLCCDTVAAMKAEMQEFLTQNILPFWMDKMQDRERGGAGTGMKGEGGQKVKEFLKKVWHVLSSNYLVIDRRGEQMAKLPFWVALLILLGSWFLILVLVVVSLFFGFTYSFEGEKEREMRAANEVMDKFSRAAESAKEEFRKK